jgi:hypothetical protein
MCGDRWAPLFRREISFSHGPKWKALINEYINNIPLSANPFPAVEQSISGLLPPRIPISKAMIAKVGAAARDIHSAAPGTGYASLSPLRFIASAFCRPIQPRS